MTTLATGWFDLQVNGCAGVNFSADGLSADELHKACLHMHSAGLAGCLATFTTDFIQTMDARIRRLVELRRQDPLAKAIIAGVHVEGPFISPANGFRGAHNLQAVRAADESAALQLLEAGEGLVRLFTLAPEHDAGLAVTRRLAREGVTVSAGHTDADLDTLRAAIDAGLTYFTHLGNGCPAQLNRHDNIIQRVLSLDGLRWISFIPDGTHVPLFALANYLRLAGPDRAILVSDAMAAAGLGPGRYRLHQFDVTIGEDLAAWAPNGQHLVGAARLGHDCADSFRRLHLDPATLRRLTRDNPRQAIGLPTA